jgi:hypothetical protein
MVMAKRFPPRHHFDRTGRGATNGSPDRQHLHGVVGARVPPTQKATRSATLAARAGRLVAVLALITAITAPGVASAADTTKGFDVWNLTRYPVILHAYNPGCGRDTYPGCDDKPASGPPLGTQFLPGQNAHFEVNSHSYVDAHSHTTQYTGEHILPVFVQVTAPQAKGPPTTYGPELWLNQTGLSPGEVICNTPQGGDGTCSPVKRTTQYQLWFGDPPGTKVTIGPDQAQAQSDVLDNLCPYAVANPPRQYCKFTGDMAPTNTAGKDAPVPGFCPIVNDTDKDTVQETISVTDTVSTATSWSVKASAGTEIAKIYKVSLEASYGKTVTDTHTFTKTFGVTVPPKSAAYVYFADPLYHYVGTFEIFVDSTTWTLNGMTIDTPRIDGSPPGGVFHVVDKPLTAQDRAAAAACRK